jgi:hypothetical protein
MTSSWKVFCKVAEEKKAIQPEICRNRSRVKNKPTIVLYCPLFNKVSHDVCKRCPNYKGEEAS